MAYAIALGGLAFWILRRWDIRRAERRVGAQLIAGVPWRASRTTPETQGVGSSRSIGFVPELRLLTIPTSCTSSQARCHRIACYLAFESVSSVNSVTYMPDISDYRPDNVIAMIGFPLARVGNAVVEERRYSFHLCSQRSNLLE